MRRPVPKPLLALLLAGLVLSVAWSVATAPLQGPDEHNHLAYVQQLAETGNGPMFEGKGDGTWSTEQTTWMRSENLLSLIGNVTARPAWSAAEQTQWSRRASRLSAADRRDGSGPNPVAQNPPLYYAYAAVPYRLASSASLPTRALLMRLWNVPLLLAMIAAAWAAAGELFGRRRWLQTIAAGVVALLPQLGFISAVVNPDIMLAAIWAVFTYVALAAIRLGPRPLPLALLGLLASASALTHARGLAIVGPLAVTLLVILWRALPLTRGVVLRMAGTVAVAALGVTVTLLYSNAHGGRSSIGGETGAVSRAGSLNGFASYLWQFYLPRLETMVPVGPPYGYRQVFIEGLAGTFGSLEVTFTPQVYSLVQVIAGLGLVALVLLLATGWEGVRARLGTLAVLLSVPVSMMLLVHAAAYRQVISPPHDPLIAGRYLLPLVVVMGLAVAYVCARLPRRLGTALGAGALGLLTLLSLSGLAMTVTRFYA